MSAWWTIAAQHVAQGRSLVLVSVCTVEGSAPREAGAKMLVWADGQDGTVGGGKLEHTIVEQARRMLGVASGDPAPWRFQHYPLGPLLGQCCGGRVGIVLEKLGPPSASWLEAIAQAETARSPYAIISRLQADGIAKEICRLHRRAANPAPDAIRVFKDGQESIAGRIGEGFTLIEEVDPRPSLLLFGAGHVGQALAPIVATLPFHLDWFDTREEFAVTGATIEDDLLRRVAAAPPDAFYLIFTQSHDLDYRLTQAVLARGDFLYCGLIGSATKRARFEKRLLADGLLPGMLGRLTCPIGAVGLTSKLPQVMAVAIAAELLLVLERSVQAGAQRTLSLKAGHGG